MCLKLDDWNLQALSLDGHTKEGKNKKKSYSVIGVLHPPFT